MHLLKLHCLAAIACVIAANSATPCLAQSAQQWWARSPQFRTRYYHVKTDLKQADARHLAEHMDITFQAYAKLFSGLKARSPRSLDLYLFANQRDYNAVLHERFRANGAGSWGMAITRSEETSLVAWQGEFSRSEMESVLQHEGFHQFARYLFPKLPSWANEGLAEVFQRGVEVDGQIVLGEVSPRDLMMLKKATDERQFRPFAQFFTMDQRVWNQHVQFGQADTNYLQAWCLVHFFLYADGAKYQPAFLEFLVGLNRELPWKDAFVRAFGTPQFKAMEEIWLDYVGQLQPSDYRETIRRLEFLAAGMQQLYEQEVYPFTVSELKSELVRSNFQHDSDLFGKPREMLADDESLYRAAAGKSRAEQVVFRLVDGKGRTVKRPKDEKALTKLHRRLAKQPLRIVTDGLKPSELVVQWKRAGKKTFQPLLTTE